MAQISERAIPPEDTFNMLQEKAKDDDNFTVKVLRRNFQGAVPELAVTMSGAQVQHFRSPELWLPMLCGGGNFSLQAYHASDLNKPVGGFLQFKVSQDAKEVDASALKKSDWRGPSQLDYPQKPAPRERESNIYDLTPPPAPVAGTLRHQNNPASYGQAGGGSIRHEDYSEGSWRERQHLQGQLEAERRKMEEERLANERQKHRDELEALKKSHEADMRAFKAEILGELRSKPADTGSSAIAELLKAQAEDRREAAKQAAEDRRAAETRMAEDRRIAEARSLEERRIASEERRAADERWNRMFEKMTDRPKEDPLAVIEKVTALIGKGNNNEAQMKMMHSMSEMMSSQVGVAMDFVQAAADMQLGGQEKESPVVKGIEAGLKGLGAMMRGSQQKHPPPQFAAPQIPQTFEQQARATQPPPPPPPPAPVDMRTVIEQIESGIRGKFPIAQVANAIVQHFNDPSIQAAVLESGGDMEKIIQSRLGNWGNESPDNKAYLDALFAEIEKRLEAAGFTAPDEEEDAEVSDDEPEEDVE